MELQESSRSRYFFPVGGTGGGPVESYFRIELWRYLISSYPHNVSRIGLLATPSKLVKGLDIDALYDNYRRLGHHLSVEFVPLSEELFGQGYYDGKIDVICITCGDTSGARRVWADNDCEQALKDYYQSGIPVTGYSAGFILFYEWASTDSVPGPDGARFGAMEGLGLIKGGAVPHADTQPERIPDFQKVLRELKTGSVLALGEEVMACYLDEKLEQLVSPLAEPVAGWVLADTVTETPVLCV